MTGTTAPSRLGNSVPAILGVWVLLAAVQISLSIALGSGATQSLGIITLYSAQALAWTALTLAIARWDGFLHAHPRAILIIGHIFAALIASVVDACVRRFVSYAFIGPSGVSFVRTALYFADLAALSYLLALWLARALEAREALVAQARHELALRSQLARARLGYLHAQLQPHFLFNALGAVSELIFESPHAAARMLRQLATVLRTTQAHAGTEISLGDEIAQLEPYLEVQRMRFSDWLAISVNIAPDSRDCLVPPLVLQPLVENAIRHGLTDRSKRGAVTIESLIRDGRLSLSVRDNGVGLNRTRAVNGTGVGLTNTSERLRTLYGSEGSLRLYADERGGTVAEVSMPARRGQVQDGSEEDSPLPSPVAMVSERNRFARRHPVAAVTAGTLIAAMLWTQQSWLYMLISGRGGEKSLGDILEYDLVAVGLWGTMVPVVFILTKRIPVTGARWRVAALIHTAAAAALTCAHAAVMLLLDSRTEAVFAVHFKSAAVITLLLYLGILAYSHRSMLEEWLSERQLAALRLNAEIAEANVAATAMAILPEMLDTTIAEVEAHAFADPLRAERAVARLGNDLRGALESSPPSPPPHEPSAGPGAISGKDRVERLAVSA